MIGDETATRIETVTPELAAQWLKGNKGNRPLSLRMVDTLATEIKAGRWRTTHQGIATDKDGNIIDGQHRLHAIVKAGVAVRVRVTRGLTRADIDAIDTGVARTAVHILAMADGVVVGSHQRSAVIAAHALVNGHDWHSGRATALMLRQALADHGADYAAVVQCITAAHDRLSPSPLLATLTLAHRVAPSKVAEFARLLRTPDGLSTGHPVIALREYVLIQYYGTGRMAAATLANKAFNAIRAFEDGRDLKLLRDSPDARRAYVARWRAAMGREPLPKE